VATGLLRKILHIHKHRVTKGTVYRCQIVRRCCLYCAQNLGLWAKRKHTLHI